MEYISVRNLETYHPGYKDRVMTWAKIHISMVQGDPEFELIESEIDKWRYVAIILLEIKAKKPLPNIDKYWISKGFDLKKRPISKTLQVLHKFIEVVTEEGTEASPRVEKSIVDKRRVEEIKVKKHAHLDCVLLTEEEFKKLVEKFGEKSANEKIEGLNMAIMSKGYKYASHYYTILNWAKKDGDYGNKQPERSIFRDS